MKAKGQEQEVFVIWREMKRKGGSSGRFVEQRHRTEEGKKERELLTVYFYEKKEVRYESDE
jgi:hypothetical protein